MAKSKRTIEQIEEDFKTQMKTCCVCNIRKPFESFYNFKNKSDNKSYRCKTCDYDARKAYSKRHPKRFNRLARNQSLLVRYGITIEEYEKIFEDQGNCCAICKGTSTKSMSEERTSFSVDHCHETGKVRGILCNQCNRGLGMLGDSLESLKSALTYLEKSNIQC